MTVYSITKEQKEKYKQTFLGYIKDYPNEFTTDFVREVISDFKALKSAIDESILEFNKTRLENDFKDLIEHVYNKLISMPSIINQQSLNEIKLFGHWDIDYGVITGTIHLDEETNQLELIEYINGYPKEYEYPFEDLRVDVLEEVLEECLTNKNTCVIM